MSIETIAVIGAGVMGAGVAQDLAQAGLRAVLIDRSDDALARARTQIQRDLRFHAMFAKGAAPAEPQAETLARLTYTTDLAACAQADCVIENVTEDWALKSELYPRLDALCPPACLLAANTSTISITRLAALTHRAPQVLGLHFMNPAPLIDTVEMIRGYHTSPETLHGAQDLLARMGKKWIVVNDSPGFALNRVLMPTINEAVYLVQEQVAGPEEIDRLFKQCLGHKTGPLETADLIGLDTVLYSIEALYASFNDSKYRPCPLLKKMVAAGLLGRKSGRGFYTYDASATY